MPAKLTIDQRTPVKTPRKVKVFRTQSPKKEQTSSKYAAARLVENSEYRKAFTYLCNKFRGARKALIQVACQQIRKELINLKKDVDCILAKQCDLMNIRNFRWGTLVDQMLQKTPLLSNAVMSAITSKKSERTMICPTQRRSLKPGFGVILSLICHLRHPRHFKFLQGLNSVNLWRNGAHRKMLQQLNSIGFCMSRNTTMNILSNMKTEGNEKLQGMKTSIEIQTPETIISDDSTSSFTVNTEDETETDNGQDNSLATDESTELITESTSEDVITSSISSSSGDEEMDEEEGIQKIGISPGYTLVWDNVGKMLKARHQSSTKQNKMMLWALSYAAENRVPTTNLASETVTKATDIDISSLFQTKAEVNAMKNRMKIIVARIITANIPYLASNFSDSANKHIRHRYWRESSRSSNVVNLGVLQENPSTTAGTIKFLEDLHQYVPVKRGKLYTLICYGDGLSCERHNDAHKARATGATSIDRLEGLEPSPQEFHKRMLLMQDTMDIFFSGSSMAEKGTLCHLRNMFGHRNVKKDVGECFNSVSDFIRFVTIGYTVLMVMTNLNMQNLSDEPLQWDEMDNMTKHKKQAYVDKLAMDVVEECWHDTRSTDVINAILGDVDEKSENYCICKTDIDDIPMIECSGPNCPSKWFHLQCMELTLDDVPDGDWYCSDGCRSALGQYQYCICKRKTNEEMIGCDNEHCQEGSWFHFSCVGLTAEDIPEGDWYCSSTCRNWISGTRTPDYKRKYVLALLWNGLLDLTRRDAVRENDGPAMISHWKHDRVQFFNRNHHKYVILGHRLLTAIGGWLPSRLRKDLIWNRTVNLTGGPGRNLEMDLVNEFLNREFKESLKQAGGNITEETVERHSKLVGHLDQHLAKVLSPDEERADIKKHIFSLKWKHDDVEQFVSYLQGEKLFETEPGRQFNSFPNFNYKAECKNPVRLKTKMMQL